MTWVKIEDTLAGNKKVRSVPLAARWTYISAICYSSLHKLNGEINRNMLGAVDGNAKIAMQLVDAGLWEPREYGWYIHDYLKHNRSKQLIEQRSETYRANALAKANGQAISSENSEQIGEPFALSLSGSVKPTPFPKSFDGTSERDREADSTANSSEPWAGLSPEDQETFHAWAQALGPRYVFRPDSADLVLTMCQTVDELPGAVIREAIRECRRDGERPWPKQVMARIPHNDRYLGVSAYESQRRAK